jgi:hypothetical protein
MVGDPHRRPARLKPVQARFVVSLPALVQRGDAGAQTRGEVLIGRILGLM